MIHSRDSRIKRASFVQRMTVRRIKWQPFLSGMVFLAIIATASPCFGQTVFESEDRQHENEKKTTGLLESARL